MSLLSRSCAITTHFISSNIVDCIPLLMFFIILIDFAIVLLRSIIMCLESLEYCLSSIEMS